MAYHPGNFLLWLSAITGKRKVDSYCNPSSKYFGKFQLMSSLFPKHLLSSVQQPMSFSILIQNSKLSVCPSFFLFLSLLLYSIKVLRGSQVNHLPWVNFLTASFKEKGTLLFFLSQHNRIVQHFKRHFFS